MIRRAWDRFWFRECDGAPLAAVRVGVASLILTWTLLLAPEVERYFTNAGEFPIAGARLWSPELVARWLMPDLLGGPAATWLLFAVLLAASASLLAGSWTRTSAGITWLLLTWFQLRNPAALDGGDEVLRLAAFYLFFAYLGLAPGQRALTLDRRRELHRRRTLDRHGTVGGKAPGRAAVRVGGDPPPARIPAWTLRMFQLQLAVLYGTSGLWKTMGPEWWDGSAVAYALGNPSFSRFGLLAPLRVQAVATVVGIAVMAWEVLFPILVWFPRARGTVLAGGVLLHGGIFATMNLGLFPLAVLALYPSFMRGRTLHQAVGAVRRAVRLAVRRAVRLAVRRTAARGPWSGPRSPGAPWTLRRAPTPPSST